MILIFAGSEVSLEASVSLKKKQNKKWTMLFKLKKKKTLLYQWLKLLNNDSEMSPIYS